MKLTPKDAESQWPCHWEEVTPAVAAQMLKGNTRNRKPRSWVRFADDLRNGRWVQNGATIAIADDGTLIDGQNRLLAVVDTGIPITTLVVRGLPMEAQDTTDGGDPRMLGQQLAIRGVANASTVAGSLRYRRQIEGWIAGDRTGFKYPIRQGLEDLESTPDIQAVAKLSGLAGGKSPGKIPPSIVGGVILAIMNDGAGATFDAVEQFWSRYHDFNTGRSVPSDVLDPVWMLREGVSKRRSQATIGSAPSAIWFAAMAIKAWNLVANEATVKQLKWTPVGPTAEKFPVPVR